MTTFDATGFSIEPAALAGAAGSFDGESDALDAAGAALDAHLASLAGCWGADSVGQRFAAAYVPAAEAVLDNIGALSCGLVRIAAALRAVAESYTAVDEAVRDAATP